MRPMVCGEYARPVSLAIVRGRTNVAHTLTLFVRPKVCMVLNILTQYHFGGRTRCQLHRVQHQRLPVPRDGLHNLPQVRDPRVRRACLFSVGLYT